MKSALISSALLISAAATPAFAQPGSPSTPHDDPVMLTAVEMDEVRAGALIRVDVRNVRIPINVDVRDVNVAVQALNSNPNLVQR